MFANLIERERTANDVALRCNKLKMLRLRSGATRHDPATTVTWAVPPPNLRGAWDIQNGAYFGIIRDEIDGMHNDHDQW